MAVYYTYTAEVDIYRNYSNDDNTSRQIIRSGQAKVATMGQSYTVYVPLDSTETYTREGYDFIGYAKLRTDTTPKYQPGDSVPLFFTGSGSKFTPIFCMWQLKTYTVSYNANGGTGAPASQTKTHGTNLTLSSTVPTRENYVFDGWATSSTGAVVYQAGDTYSTEADVTLYAIWHVAAATLNSVTDPINIGASGTASWTKVDNAHTYKLVLSLSGAADIEYDNIPAGSTSKAYTISSSWLNALPNNASATATATLYTYNSGALVGSTSKTFTVNVASSVKPAISAFTAVAHSQNQVAEGWGIAVQGYSYLTLSVTATAGTGASIAQISITGQGINQSSSAATGNTAVLSNAGTSTYTVTVTDSRGRSISSTLNVTVYEYSNPTVSSLQAVRCLSNGTQSDVEGNYLKALPVFVYSSVNGNNSLSVKKIEYKHHTALNWTTGVASATSGSWSAVFGPADITKTYDVRCVVTDALGNSYTLEVIVPPVVGFAVGLNNDRARFGGPVEEAGLVCDWKAKFKGVVDKVKYRCYNGLLSPSWYRVGVYYTSNQDYQDYYIGGAGDLIGITINCDGTENYPNEMHHVDLVLVWGGISFVNETSITQSSSVDKIRYIVNPDTHTGYIDIHYKRSYGKAVNVTFDMMGNHISLEAFSAVTPYAVADSPTGEVVQEEMTFKYYTTAAGAVITQDANTGILSIV